MWPDRLRLMVVALVVSVVMSIGAGCSGGDSQGDSAAGRASSGDGSAGGQDKSAAAGSEEMISEEVRDLSSVALTGLDGTRSKVSDYEGKILFVTFLATWHADSQKMIPILTDIHKKYNKNVHVMTVAMDKQGAGAVRAFFAGKNIPFDIFVDGERTANKFGGARQMPTTYILDRDGKFFHRIDGLLRGSQYDRIIISMYKQHL